MKTANLVVILVFATTGLFDRLSAQTNVPAGPPMSRMVQGKAAYLAEIQSRLPRLEKLGEVPDNADLLDLQAVQQTTWWGKPLDPKVFWKDRVIWNDESAERAAQRYGRFYPPVPEHVPKLMAGFPVESRSRRDIATEGDGGPDSGYSPGYHLSDLESGYWNWFWRTKPKPPPVLEREQFEAAERILWMHQPLIINGVNRHYISPGRAEMEEYDTKTQKERAGEIGVPKEALTEDALFWSYVAKNRGEYREIIGRRNDTNDLAVGAFLPRLKVDLRYMTEPPEAVVLDLANAWKVAYLRRLSAEKADQSYIDAYLKAWNLRTTDVFSNPPPAASVADPDRAAFADRIRQLEKLREIPETIGTVSITDWHAAERTSWWGKPLNPRVFWESRVVWQDGDATNAAVRHGRAYPPVPYHDPGLRHEKDDDKDRELLTGGAKGPWLVLHYTDREDAFWNKLASSHHRTVLDVEKRQWVVAPRLLEMSRRFKDGATKEEWTEFDEIRQREIQHGYPPEAFTDDAMLWSYVVKERQEYRELIRPGQTAKDGALEKFKQGLCVDAKYLTEPSDAEVLKRARAWKIDYLRRLRAERIHEPYMNAYLKAWDLKPDEVFTNVAISPQPTR